MKNFQLFDQNHGLSPLQKCQFCGFLKPMFFLFRKACLLYKTSKIVFPRFIFTIYDMGIFDQNHGLTPLQKCQFCAFLKPMFLLFRKACLLCKTSKIVFPRFIFTIYDMGIQVVTSGYRGLQGGTRG